MEKEGKSLGRENIFKENFGFLFHPDLEYWGFAGRCVCGNREPSVCRDGLDRCPLTADTREARSHSAVCEPLPRDATHNLSNAFLICHRALKPVKYSGNEVLGTSGNLAVPRARWQGSADVRVSSGARPPRAEPVFHVSLRPGTPSLPEPNSSSAMRPTACCSICFPKLRQTRTWGMHVSAPPT